MRQIFMYMSLPRTSFYQLSSSRSYVAALTNFTLDWGTDRPFSQPDPAVLSCTLRDSTGELAGCASSLAGARIVVQFSRKADYSMFPSLAGLTYQQTTSTIANMYIEIEPDTPVQPDEHNTTIFDGIVSTGTSITRTNGGFLLKVKAVSRMVMWRQMRDNGPTVVQGYHWTGTPADRLKELNNRAAKARAPIVDASSVDLPPSVAPYETNSHPSQFDLLQRLFSHSQTLPIWGEYPNGSTTIIRPYKLAEPALIWMDKNGDIGTIVEGTERPAIPASQVPDSSTLETTNPISGIKINAHDASIEDGKLKIDDSTLSVSDTTSSTAGSETENYITLESDTCTGNRTNGLIPGAAYTLNEPQRAAIRRTIREYNRHISYKLTIDSAHVDPEVWPELFETRPSGPEIITDSMYAQLIDSDNMPLTLNAFTTIGGTITYEIRENTPILTHELHTTPLPRSADTLPWNRFHAPTAYEKVRALTISSLKIVSN